MTSVRTDPEVIFQVKSRRDSTRQSLRQSFAEHFLRQMQLCVQPWPRAGYVAIPRLLQAGKNE